MTSADFLATEQRRHFRMPEQLSLIGRLLRLKPPPARVLDVGCDKGYFIDEMRRYGYGVVGVEPSGQARRYCDAIGLQVESSVAEAQGSYDIISLWHVLEHIREPVEFLRELVARLEPSGVLALRVPNFGCAWSRILRDKWIWFQPKNHCFHYTSKSIRLLLEQAGLIVVELRSQSPNTDLTRRAGRLATTMFARYLGSSLPLRKSLIRAYEDLTGVELLAIAREASSAGRREGALSDNSPD